MNTHRHILLLAALLALAAVPARAQFNETNNLFYHAFRVPQSNQLNPAFYPKRNTFYFMLPGVDFQFGMPLSMNDILHYDAASQTTIINLDSVLHTLSEDNKFRLGFDMQLFGFGLKIKHLFVDASLRLRAGLNVSLPSNTVDALLQGNISDDGTTLTEMELLNGDIFGAQAYMETSVGAGYHFDKLNLTVGAHVKLLSGIFNLQTDKTRVVVNTNDDLDHMTASIYYELQGAAMVPYDTANGFQFDNVSDVASGLFDNTGLAFDIGARYDFGPFSFSLAINDLSAGIHWSKNVFSYLPENGNAAIEFDGVDINTMLNNGTFSTDSITSYLEDRFNGLSPQYVDTTGDYYYPIPTKINLGASFTFLNYLRAGLLFHGQFDRGLLSKGNTIEGFGKNYTNTFRWNTTLSFSANLFNWAEFIVGSSMVYDGKKLDLFNPGAGVILSIGTAFQTYVMADYVSSIRLVEAKAFNVKLGMNLLFGRGGKKVVENPVEVILTPNEE